jgi:hypothetical protein
LPLTDVDVDGEAPCPIATILRPPGFILFRRSSAKEHAAAPQLRTSWEQKMKKKREHKAMQEFQKQLRDKHNELLDRQRLERENKRKQKALNREKSVVVQVVKNPMKLKKLKRSQLRNIRKGADPNAPPVQQV